MVTTVAEPKTHYFNLQLYSQLRNAKGNMFYSPFSIAVCLGMAGTGSKGKTREEFVALFGEDFDEDFKQFIDSVQSEDVVLKTANAIWVEKTLPLNEEYLKSIEEVYSSSIHQMDFVNNPGQAVTSINTWTDVNTNGKIKEIVTNDSVDSETKMVLTNAIYFKGSWSEKFEERMTMDAKFFTKDGPVETKMMRKYRTYFSYWETSEEQIIDLPYKGDDLVMTVIMPRDGIDISDYEKTLHQKKLDGLYGKMCGASKVNLTFPRFKTAAQFSLAEALKDLGLKKAFTDSADFSGISNTPEGLKISSVLHKSFVEVNEEGTEAAAVTAAAMVCCSAGMFEERIFEFNANRPFIFLIRNRKTNTVYFAGRVNDPTKEN